LFQDLTNWVEEEEEEKFVPKTLLLPKATSQK
jgi:hypothetical protein